MSESTFVFKYVANGNQYEVDIKVEFLTIVPKPHLCTETFLFKKGINDYVHNATGPAVRNLTNGQVFYCLNGKYFNNKESWEKEATIFNFNDKLQDMLDD